MGDSGEGLIDAESRIQERLEERQRERAEANHPKRDTPKMSHKLESLKLARTQMTQQLERTAHEVRRKQITDAIAEIDRQIAELD
jgi:hypothetical protein